MKKFESFKECIVKTCNGMQYTQYFHHSWNYKTIQSYMLDHLDIDKDFIIEIRISTVNIYKHSSSVNYGNN